MSKAIFQVKKPGLATSFQDAGRYGFQRYGVVTSGAMDLEALQWANILVGNPVNSACIEVCLIGPTLTFLEDVTFSICGADLSPILNGRPIKGWRTYKGKTGDELAFGKQVSGNYAYLAVSGGFHSEMVMGSQSTYAKANIGTVITEGLTISGFPQCLQRNRGLNSEFIPKYEDHIKAKFIIGPHQSYIQQDSITHFEKQSFSLTQGDRMGYRFQAETPIETKDQATLPSDPIPLGGIQIPPDGNPIILLADRQTTGGYPRIGTVISTDLSKVVQLPMRKGTASFTKVSIEEAHRIYKKRYLETTPYKYI
ncbi:5-oxoprolinase subunit C family protein [Bacillus sp. AK128]